MAKHYGRCSCGEVQFHITDEPMFTHACHCKLCQRYTASAFVVHSNIEAENFVVEKGNLITTVGPSGSGSGHTIKRCKSCGDQIFSHFGLNGTDKILVFKTTTLDDAELFPPQAHIYTKSKLSWVALGTETPCFDEFTLEVVKNIECLAGVGYESGRAGV